VNFLVLLGWSPGGEEEIFGMEDLIKLFSADRVSKSPAVFDATKMNWMNNFYLKRQPLDLITEMCVPHLQKAGFIEEMLSDEKQQWVRSIVALYQDQMSYCAQIVPLAALFFLDEVVYDEEATLVLKEPQLPEVLSSFVKHLSAQDAYNVDVIKAALKDVQKETGHKGKALFMPVRVAATGQAHGRDLAETLYLLGREKVIARTENVIANGK